ncbi:ATP-grasp domain-containing protein [Williamsia sterculiae]|uniref:ATP-grasp domain-containing protein n=1 Tax=Williamsia sterculiae TaxID=1344003 RepID=A0A1N7CGC5_9NOCA|nr:ATP-grasp domain-containing protein [Williamsia sterculiae]SIR62678.1 ATP-grasp domain-containing protein [Williamsia sterculiae]
MARSGITRLQNTQGESDRKHVCITFGRSFLTLDLARLLAAAGHKVTIVDSIPLAVTRFSNATYDFYKTPSPKFQPREYCLELARICREQKIDVVIPIHEETDIISMMTDVFPPECTLFLSDFVIENGLHNKYDFQQLLADRNIPTLRFAELRSPEDVAALDFTTPFALKQCYSRGSQKVMKVYPGDPLTGLEFDPTNPWLAQEWLKGDKYCTYSVCHEGKVYAHATYPVRYAIDHNSCLTFESVEHQGILDWVTDFIADIGFTGQVGFDFIENEERGLFTIECNPRATSGIMMFSPQDRVDRAFFGENDEIIFPDPYKRKMIGPGMLIYGWRKSARPPGVSLRQYVRDYWETDDVITSFTDMRPAFMVPFAYANILRDCAKYHVGLAEGFMHDHEWDGVRI